MSSSTTETAFDVVMPQMGVSVAEGTVVEWKVGVGDPVTADQTVCEISTDKIDSEVPAPVAGIVTEVLVPVGETVTVGTVLARIDTGGGGSRAPRSNGGSAAAPTVAPAVERAAAPTPARAAAPARSAPGRRYSPVVQRIAAEHGIDLATVAGTGRGGRVRKQDVIAVVGGNGDRSGGSRRRTAAAHREPVPPRPARGRCRCRRAVAHAPADRRAHEALAAGGGDVHDAGSRST